MNQISYVNADITFVIPAKNEEDNIANCIESILACDRRNLALDICIVDNGSTDETVAIAQAYGARVLVKPELSISELRNVGAASSSSQWIGFVDADVTIGRDWIARASSEIDNQDVAAVGCSPGIPTDSNWVTRAWHLHIGIRSDYAERCWLSSMNMLVRRDVFDEFGGFDESLFTCEDVDLGYRMSDKYRIIYDNRIHAIHHGEAKSITELFRKEAWRGSYNYRGMANHGLRINEIPSLAQPVITALGLVACLVGVVSSKIQVIIAGFVLLFLFPFAKTIQILIYTKEWQSTMALIVVWSTYSVARVWSAIMELRHLFKSLKGVATTP